MTAISDQVKPGDVISSDLFNRVIALLNEHDALLASTTPGTGLVITQLLPTGPYRIGDTLQILGQNFQFGIGATRVFLNATPVLNFSPTSTDSRLQFVIPTVPGVVEAGSIVDLAVLNQTQSATRQIVLRPIQNPLQGNVTVEWRSVTPTTITPSQPATFVYRITSGTNNRATWDINPLIDVAANAPAWNSQLSVRDSVGTELNPRQVTLDPGQQIDVQINIGSVPSGTNGVTFGLTVNVSSGPIAGSSGIRQFTVGTLVPPPDTTFTLATVPIFSGGALVGSTLTVPGGGGSNLVLSADLTVAANYTVTRSVLGGAAGWAVNLDSGTTDAFTINAADLVATGHTQRLLRYQVTATAAALTPAQIQITVQRTGGTGSRSIVLNTVRS